MSTAINVICLDRPGMLRDIAGAVAKRGGNIIYTQQFVMERGLNRGKASVYMEIDGREEVSEADRHNLRGERISVDTIPLVGEEAIADAVRAVSRLPRASILVLAGALMGGRITEEVKRLQAEGIPVIALKMAGSVPDQADLVVTDPIQAGTFAVMHVASTAVFDITRVRGREF